MAKFNGKIRLLISWLAKKYPLNADIDRAKKRINMAIETWPVTIIQDVGTHLYNYKETVFCVDESFLANTFKKELEEGVDETKVSLCRIIIPKVKEAYEISPPKVKQDCKDIVIELLDIYIEYRGKILDRRN